MLIISNLIVLLLTSIEVLFAFIKDIAYYDSDSVFIFDYTYEKLVEWNTVFDDLTDDFKSLKQ